MNRALNDAGGTQLLGASQFPLLGNGTKGRRPGFDLAGTLDEARALYDDVKWPTIRGLSIKTRLCGAHMQVGLVNDGIVIFLLERRCRSKSRRLSFGVRRR